MAGSDKATPQSAQQKAGQPPLIESYRQLAQQNPKDRFALNSLLIAYLTQKAYVDGIRQFQKFIAADSVNDVAYMCMAVLYEKGGYDNEAIQSYVRVLKLNPGEELAYLFLSTRYLKRKAYNEAAQVCFNGIERFPKSDRLHFNLGFALANVDKHDRAIEAFEKAIEINPQSSEAYFNRDLSRRKRDSTAQIKEQAPPRIG